MIKHHAGLKRNKIAAIKYFHAYFSDKYASHNSANGAQHKHLRVEFLVPKIYSALNFEWIKFTAIFYSRERTYMNRKSHRKESLLPLSIFSHGRFHKNLSLMKICMPLSLPLLGLPTFISFIVLTNNFVSSCLSFCVLFLVGRNRQHEFTLTFTAYFPGDASSFLHRFFLFRPSSSSSSSLLSISSFLLHTFFHHQQTRFCTAQNYVHIHKFS